MVTNFYSDLLDLSDFADLGMNPAELIPAQTQGVCKALAKVAESGDPTVLGGEFSIHAPHAKFNLTSGQITTATEIFLQALKKALPDELFVEVSKILVLSDKTVLAGLSQAQEEESQHSSTEEENSEAEATKQTAASDSNNLDLVHKV